MNRLYHFKRGFLILILILILISLVSSLSFNKQIKITKAEHLNSSRGFIEDIYNEVKEKDNVFSSIPPGDFVRVSFEKNLTNKNDITIYAKSNVSSKVEVYEKGSSNKIAEILGIKSPGLYKTFLTNLIGIQDTFDLLVVGGQILFDWIVDPITDDSTVAQIYQTSTTQDLDTETSIQFNQETFVGSSFSHPSNTKLQFKNSGWYKVSYGCLVKETATLGGRQEQTMWLENDSGSEIFPSRTYTYLRNDDPGYGNLASMSAVTLVYMSANGNLTLQSTSLYGAKNVDPEESCWIYAEQLHRPAVLIRETTDYDNNINDSSEFTQDFGEIVYENSSVFTADLTNNRIAVDGSGWYKIYYVASSEQTSGISNNDRITPVSYLSKNSGTPITPSKTYSYHKRSDQAAYSTEEGYTIAYLNAGDNVSLRRYASVLQQATALTYTLKDTWLMIEKLQDNNNLLIWDSLGGQGVSSSTAGVESTPINITWNSQTNVGSYYSHSAGQANFTINKDGWFEISYAVSFKGATGTNRKASCAKMLKNGQAIEPSHLCEYERDTSSIDENSISANFIVNNSAGDEYVLQHSVIPELANGGHNLIATASWISVIPIKLESVPPLVSVLSPSSLNYSRQDFWFNLSANDTGSGMGSCWYNLDGGQNITLSNGGDDIYYDFNNSIGEGQYTAYFFCNDSVGNLNNTEFVNFGIDITSPLLFLEEPENKTYNTNQLWINYSVSDATLNSCWYTDDSGATNYTLPGCQNKTYTASQGYTTIIVYANDSAGNLNFTNVTFFVDSINPLIEYSTGTEINNSNKSQNWVFVNVSVTEINEQNITFALYNSSGEVNKTTYTTPTRTINWTQLSDGDYWYNVTIYDSAGNLNSTETRKITLDTTLPKLAINSPAHANISSTTIIFNVTLDEIGDWCAYSLDDSSNITMTSEDFLTWNATNSSMTQGQHTVVYYCNDSAGNINSSSRTFNIDTILPVINLYEPQETNYSINDLWINYTSIDENSGINSCWYTDDSGATNYTLPGCQNKTYTASQGYTTIIVYANDSVGNLNFTNVTFFVDSINPLIEYGSQTRPNSSYWENNWIYVDILLDEVNFMNLTYSLYNSTGIINSTTYFSKTLNINWTGLDNNNILYWYNVSAYDTLGNFNFTETRYLTLTPGDIQPPVITINSPAHANISSTTIIFNVTLDEIGDWCAYSLDDSSNITMTSEDFLTWNATNSSMTQGQHTVVYYCNDSVGNMGSNFQVFEIDTTNPLIEYSTGTEINNSNKSQNWVFVNVSVTEINEQNITFALYNSSGEVNKTTYTTPVRTINWTQLSDGDYWYNVTIYDSAGNLNSTETRKIKLDITVPFIYFTAPTPLDNSSTFNDFIYVNVSVVDDSPTSAFIDWNYSLVGYWSMEFHNSSGVYDNSTYNNFGDFKGTFNNEDFVAGKYGSALSLDGVNDYLEVPDSPSLNPPGNFSAEVWFKSNSLSNWQGVISKLTNVNTGTGRGWNLQVGTTQNIASLMADSSGNYVYLKTSWTPSVNVWYHVVLVHYSNNTNQLWVNGNLEATNTHGIAFTNNPFQIGKFYTDGASLKFNGTIDEVRIHNRSLSSNEIMASYDNGLYSLHNNFTSLLEGSYDYYAYAIDIAGNFNITETRNITIDVTPPIGNLLSPEDNTYTNNLSQNFTANASDELSLANATLFIFNSTSQIIYENTIDLEGVKYSDFWENYTFDYDGVYNWSYRIIDSVGNTFDTENRTLTIDTTTPLIEYSTGTEINNSNKSQNWIFVNVSVTEINEQNITFALYNSSGEVNKTTYTTPIRTINWTGLNDGGYWYNVTIYDSAGNLNSTETRKISLDTIFPLVNYVSPTEDNATEFERKWIFVNVSVTEINEQNITFALYNSSGEVNKTTYTTLARTINWTGLSNINVTYFYNVTVYDLAGNLNFTETRQIKLYDSTGPRINLIRPESKAYSINTSLPLNHTVEDSSGVDSCWWNLDEGTNNSITCNTNTTFDTTDGNHILYFYSNDSLGNIGRATVNFIVSTTGPAITLLNPTDNENLSSFGIVNFTFEAIDPDGVDTCTLYGNWSGGWHANKTLNNWWDSNWDYRKNITISNVASNDLINFTIYLNITKNSNINSDYSDLRFINGSCEEGQNLVLDYQIESYDSNNANLWVRLPSLPSGGGKICMYYGNNYATNAENPGSTWDPSYKSIYHLNHTSGNAIDTMGNFNAEEFFIPDSNMNIVGIVGRGDYFDGNDYLGTNPEWNVDGSHMYCVWVKWTIYHDGTILEDGGTFDGHALVVLSSGRIRYAEYYNGAANYLDSTNAYNDGNWHHVCGGHNTTDQFLYIDGELEQRATQGDGFVGSGDARIGSTNGANPGFGDSSSYYLQANLDELRVSSQYRDDGWVNQSYQNIAHYSSIVSEGEAQHYSNFTFFKVNLSEEGFFRWNVMCNDTQGYDTWAGSNFTFALFLFPDKPSLSNITQTLNNGLGNITLFWNQTNHALKYKIYYSSLLDSEFTYLNETSDLNYTDTTFSGNKRRFYRIDSWNPTGQNNSSSYFGAHVYTLKHNGNTRNWIGFPTNFSYLQDANGSLNEITNATAFTMWNETIQKKVTCNKFSCPSGFSCTNTNCNFVLQQGRGYELNINSSAPQSVNWSGVGIIYSPTNISLIKNTTSFGKNWIAMYANTTLNNAQELITSIDYADAVTDWDEVGQRSKGLIISPFLWIPYIGTNFNINFEKGYEVSVTQNNNWTQV